MEEAVELLTISELLRRGRPFTATSSLNSSPSVSVRPPSSKSKSMDKNSQSQPPPPGLTTNSNPNLKILAPLSQPAMLVGTLLLPTETLKCPNKNCFQFSDCSSTICCDILDFSVRVIGKKIQVLAWNFIPLKHSGGGFLEIIKWSFPDSSTSTFSRCSSMDSFPIVSGSSPPPPPPPPTIADDSKARFSVHGPIESTSPVSLVPCLSGDSKTNNLRGFIVRIMVCECKLCNSKESVTVLHNLAQGQHPHSFTKPLFIYFFGSSWSWHPVIAKLVGNDVRLSGLKKKLVFIGKDKSQLMFVTTENSVLHLPRLSKKWSPFLRNVIVGKGECGAYTGVVKGVYMQGMVIELDKEVWLVLTDQLLAAPHSLRVGAIISLRNVHFVNPKFTWTQMLILGTCLKTSITVESFSPLETGALLIISSFRKKFAGILSEKEILGSKHKEGLAQMFSNSHLPPSVIHARRGILTELCKHNSCGCDSEPYCADLKLVAPISTFLHHCEVMWMKALLQMESNFYILRDESQFDLVSCEGRSHSRTLRRMFHSEDIGVSLLGSLKISPYSGRLQLVDATGSIDVIIPNFPSTWKSNCIYEVVDYNLIVEGTPDLVDHTGLPDSESLSCRHIFYHTPWAREMKLTIYISFRLGNATCRNLPFYPCVDWNNEFMELQGGRFHLICVTHKYPVLQKFKGDPVITDCCTMFAEAIILPWDLFLGVKDGAMLPFKISGDWLNESLAHYPTENYQERLSNKKRKIDQASSQALKRSNEGECGNLSSLEIPCLATVRTANRQNLGGSGKLCFTKSKVKIDADCKLSAEKVLLEFNSENLFKYPALQIGSYYIIKHHPEESFCSIKDYDNVSGVRVIISSRTHMWSLSFSSDEGVTNNKSSNLPSQSDSSISCREFPIRDQVELLLRSTGNVPELSSDVCLHLSANAKAFLEVKLNENKEAHTEPIMTPEETLSDSSDILTMISSTGFFSGSLDFTCLFPEGNLTSVCGDVVDIHGFDCNSAANAHLSCERLDDGLHMKFFQESTNISCIHVLVDDQMVSIFGSLSKHAYPVGFGPGVNATFHRILKLRVTNKLQLTPASFIVLNSIRVANEQYDDKCFKFCSTLCMPSASSLDNVSSGMISELIQCSDCKPMRFNCRVVAVHVLVLEKNIKYYGLRSEVQAGHFVDIPLVGFVLDDGSSTCCCWANAERAATLMRLHEELPMRAFESSGCTLKWLGIDKNCWKSTMFHLERILRKHGRIIVRNDGPIIDSYQDYTVSVSSDDALSSSDENLLKFIVFNACFGTSWTVIAGLMDPNAVKQLEKEHLIQMGTTVLSMQNLWAMEVQYMNTLSEARNIIEQLIDR
ncbi:CST complex subunit CTC1 isoform X2 [Hevea brasiliensis]|uniref:CST complex subunit CTC1 isoform X2 n=1 Tax=Hevea brasiliensis TaxID=3981 RepID=UPI0025D8BF6B|nr:CST complex subunit CTC1 isoform X2 [Hevea brasiliensis]